MEVCYCSTVSQIGEHPYVEQEQKLKKKDLLRPVSQDGDN